MRSISLRRFDKWGLALTVAGLCATPALAQESKGEFTMTRQVHWGSLILPAGSYAYSVEHHASEVLLIRPKIGGNGHFILAKGVSRPDEPMPNRLTIERRGMDWYVTSIVVNDFGETLLFQAPPSDATTDSAAKLATIASK
jgi:hypothetical protein